MADGLQEVLSKYVPASVLEEAVEAVKTTEIAPEWYRNDIAKVGAEAKEGRDAKARLASIESAPKRKEALKRVGVDYDAEKKYGQEKLDSLPADKLDDLDFVAQFVKEAGFDAKLPSEEGTPAASGAEEVVNFTQGAVGGQPPQQSSYEADMAAATTPEQVDDVYRKHGKPVPQRSE